MLHNFEQHNKKSFLLPLRETSAACPSFTLHETDEGESAALKTKTEQIFTVVSLFHTREFQFDRSPFPWLSFVFFFCMKNRDKVHSSSIGTPQHM